MIKIEINTLSLKHRELILPNIEINFNTEKGDVIWKEIRTARIVIYLEEYNKKYIKGRDIIIVPIYYKEQIRIQPKYARRTYDITIFDDDVKRLSSMYKNILKIFTRTQPFIDGTISIMKKTENFLVISFYEGCNMYPGLYLR